MSGSSTAETETKADAPAVPVAGEAEAGARPSPSVDIALPDVNFSTSEVKNQAQAEAWFTKFLASLNKDVDDHQKWFFLAGSVVDESGSDKSLTFERKMVYKPSSESEDTHIKTSIGPGVQPSNMRMTVETFSAKSLKALLEAAKEVVKITGGKLSVKSLVGLTNSGSTTAKPDEKSVIKKALIAFFKGENKNLLGAEEDKKAIDGFAAEAKKASGAKPLMSSAPPSATSPAATPSPAADAMSAMRAAAGGAPGTSPEEEPGPSV